MNNPDPLAIFLPAVARWFRSTLGEPTMPQRLGWPVIAAGEHTLVLAPTGSGKTLTAFLACLDSLWREGEMGLKMRKGVQVLYISPLKALNNDIHRNLQVPLEGVQEEARRSGPTLPELTTAVRTGDTPQQERQKLVRKPPHILITTPESLHLLLTSKAREVLRDVRTCIVDEIHALCSNKRGVFLALLLERLQALQTRPIQRIGLSATQRPLDEVARYLGGATWQNGELVPRPVTILDAGQRKDLDLQVVSPIEQFGPLPEKTIWPSIYRLLTRLIQEHRSTIVFANDRRSVERITSFVNEEARGEPTDRRTELVPFNTGTEQVPFHDQDSELVRSHHGSVSLEVRRQVEEALKEGRLRGVVATASLEMGIDMGAVDLVCQVQSPGNVARGLQRVGRAGHLVGAGSKGRFIPKNSADLLEQAVLTREMFAGRVETLRVPANCLDVLAQQLVAMTAMDDWQVPDLLALVRQAYPYRDLSPHAFEATLEMISGRYRFGDTQARHQALQARVSWDRVHNRLVALPGSKHMALRHGGVIPDTGQYAVYRSGGDVRLGELDEEFVYERRPGDVFLLGTTPWRLERIDADRVFVTPAEGEPAMLPFWRGEGIGRSVDLGEAYGRFLDDLIQKLESDTDPNILAWLRSEAHLDENAARSLLHYVQRQHLVSCVPTNRRILVEASRDQLGDWQVILLSPFGARVHLGLRLALEAVLTQRLGCRPQCLHHDDGVIVRLPDRDEPILDLLNGLSSENVEDLLLAELANSPLFALRFRQNAARALLMPSGSPDRRAPLWLQRLRGRDLLQIVRSHADFPVVVETFRECLHDHLDLDRLRTLLEDIRAGRIEVVARRAEVPSPFAANLLFSFTAAFLYQFDRVEQNSAQTNIDRDLLDQMLAPRPGEHLLDPRGIHRVESRLRGVGHPPRTPAETAEWLRRLGDVTPDELEGPTAGFLEQLRNEGRAVLFEMPAGPNPHRWILAEEEELYRSAFSSNPSDEKQEAASSILLRFLNTHALVSLADVLNRYPFEPAWAQRQLEAWAASGRLIPVQSAPGSLPTPSWSAPENLREIQTTSLAILRREVIACEPPQFVDFVLRWQRVHPETRVGGLDGLDTVLDRLEGLALPAELWDQFVLPARVLEYQPRWLADWLASGQGLWVLQGEEGEQLAFLRRESVRRLRPPASASPAPRPNATEIAHVEEALRVRGASFLTDLALDLNLPPSTVRSALHALACQGVATNDQLSAATFQQVSRSPRRLVSEGRWSLIPWGAAETEALAVMQASMLLNRYGIVGRELAILDPWLLPWRVLYEVLSLRELAGEVRRGYFVEGLAGAQFALPEAVDLLQSLHLPSTASAPVILLHSLDPVNLYGAGAPLDVLLLDGGTRSFLRRPGNWLVVRAGRPILLIEQHGKRLTALASASVEELRESVAFLPQLLRRRGGSPLPKLTVEEWNGEAVVATAGLEMLESAGFIRELQTMTLYAGFASTT